MDYQAIYNAALSKLFPDAVTRAEAETILAQYGTESYHLEPDRVKAAILKLCESNPDKLAYWTAQACADYRDILTWAEYPESSKNWSLKDKNTERYRQLQEQDRQQYLAWVERLES